MLEKIAKHLILDPNLGPKTFYCGFYLYWQLDIDPSYYPIKFPGKLTNQTLENGKKNLFWGLILAHLVQIWAVFCGFFLY